MAGSPGLSGSIYLPPPCLPLVPEDAEGALARCPEEVACAVVGRAQAQLHCLLAICSQAHGHASWSLGFPIDMQNRVGPGLCTTPTGVLCLQNATAEDPTNFLPESDPLDGNGQKPDLN